MSYVQYLRKDRSIPHPTVAVDLDGVLAHKLKPFKIDEFGSPIEGAKEFVAELRKSYRVMIWTRRCTESGYDRTVGELRKAIAAWLLDHGFEFDDIWCGQGKPMAVAFVDDRAVYCDGTNYEEALSAVRALSA